MEEQKKVSYYRFIAHIFALKTFFVNKSVMNKFCTMHSAYALEDQPTFLLIQTMSNAKWQDGEEKLEGLSK